VNNNNALLYDDPLGIRAHTGSRIGHPLIGYGAKIIIIIEISKEVRTVKSHYMGTNAGKGLQDYTESHPKRPQS
jgi:hypothetical protein